MEFKNLLLVVSGTVLLIGGYLLNTTYARLETEKIRHLETQTAFENFRDKTKKISENVSIHYEELLNESTKQANKELANQAKALASATDTSRRLQLSLDDLHSRLKSGSCEAAKEYAAVSGQLLGVCQQSLIWLSKEANGHRIDAHRFDKAWPTDPDKPNTGNKE